MAPGDDGQDRGRGGPAAAPAERRSPLTVRRPGIGSLLGFVLAGGLGLWLIVHAIDQIEYRIKWGANVGRSVLPQRRITLPKEPGLYAVDGGQTFALTPGKSLELSPQAEFIASSVFLDSFSLHAYPLESTGFKTDGTAEESRDLEKLLHALNTDVDGKLIRSLALPPGIIPVECLEAAVSRRPDLRRFVPAKELPAGLYQTGAGAFFFVKREALHRRFAEAADIQAAEHRWRAALTGARVGLELGLGDARLQSLIQSIPMEALKEGESSLASGAWEEAAKGATFVSRETEKGTETHGSALDLLRRSVFESRADGTILDRQAQLIWSREVWPRPATENMARELGAFIAKLDIGGKTDWRAPTVAELGQLNQRLGQVSDGADRQISPFHWSEPRDGVFWSIEGEAFSFKTGSKTAAAQSQVASVRAVRPAVVDPNEMLGRVPAIHVAVTLGYTGWAKSLLEAGVDPNTEWDKVPLIAEACVSDNTELIRVLLQKGATASMIRGVPEVIWAVREKQDTVLEALLAGGRDPNARDQEGRTALMIAVASQRVAPVRLLLAHNADSQLTDRRKAKALDYLDPNGGGGEVRMLIAGTEPREPLSADTASKPAVPQIEDRGLATLGAPPPRKAVLSEQAEVASPPSKTARTIETLNLRDELLTARREAELARSEAVGISAMGKEALKDRLMKSGDGLLRTSKERESEGDLHNAIFYARKAKEHFDGALRTLMNRKE